MRCSLTAVPAPSARKLAANPAGLEEYFAAAAGSKKSLRLEKSWHGLHFVLTGTAGETKKPLGFLLAGGETVGEPVEEDETVIPARLLLPEQVQRLAAALASIDGAEFDRRFDPKRMAKMDIYPDIWNEPRGELLSEYRMYFDALKQFAGSAANRGDAILVMIG